MIRSFKKFALFALLFALAFSIMSFGAFAEEDGGRVVADSAYAQVGEVFSVDVYVSSSADVGVVSFTLGINSELVTLVADQCVTFNGTVMNGHLEDQIAFVYHTNDYTGNNTDNGGKIVLAKLFFKVNDGVANGDYKNYLSLIGEIDAADININSLNMSFASPTLSVGNGRECGDIYDNKDGRIDSKDAIYILQYLAKMITFDDNELKYANTFVGDDNADGSPKINSKDAIILLQYLAKMNVTLGSSERPSTGTPTHTHTVIVDKEVPATCTSTGLSEGSHCVTCDEVLVKQIVIPMLPHNPVEIPAQAPTCVTSGLSEGLKCADCELILVEQETVAAIGHVYQDELCTYCGGNEFAVFDSLSAYSASCTVSDNGGVVTLYYDTPFAVKLKLDYFALEQGKTYVFSFGPNSGKVKLSSLGMEYTNVRIEISQRESVFPLILDNISFTNRSTIISCSCSILDLTLTGENVTIKTTAGGTGSTGESFGAFQIGNGGPGGRGGDANIPIRCAGVLELRCGANVLIRGGDGGQGGQGGNSKSSGSTGGTGGRGGDGAVAIWATLTNVYFINEKTVDNIVVVGGAGGAGGAGGYGSAVFGIGKTYADDGDDGTTASASNRAINYVVE